MGVLDMGRGRLRKAVEEVRVEGVPGEEGVGMLQLAASQGHMEICKYLVDTLKVDVDDADDEGRTSLLKAIHSGHQGIAMYLLDHDANPDQAMRCGLAPLHSAAGLGDYESVKQLLAKGAFVNPVCTYGARLRLAAHEGQDGTMKILLDHNADCNKIVNGITPLLLATRSASEKCMELLVEEAGADRTLSDAFVNYMSIAFVDDGDSASSDSEPEEAGANHHVSVNDNHVSRRKIAEFKSLGLEAVEKKDYRFAAGFYSKDYASSCEALYDGFKLDPGNIEIENSLREALESLKVSQST
uniref:Uncharacterized protein n=1 Tax=Leersia perrieri TaxID=77586 RepID=A0A0D9VWB2_9ORYZ